MILPLSFLTALVISHTPTNLPKIYQLPIPSRLTVERRVDPPPTVLKVVTAAIQSEVVAEPTPTPEPTVEAYVAPPPPSASASIQDIKSTIVYWANYYGVDATWMLRVAKCESGYQQYVINYGYTAGGGHPSGVFQFLPDTFYANAASVGVPSPDLFDYHQQAQVAAWMFERGQSTQWACK